MWHTGRPRSGRRLSDGGARYVAGRVAAGFTFAESVSPKRPILTNRHQQSVGRASLISFQRSGRADFLVGKTRSTVTTRK